MSASTDRVDLCVGDDVDDCDFESTFIVVPAPLFNCCAFYGLSAARLASVKKSDPSLSVDLMTLCS